jgi:hypothetical protein
MRQLSRGPQVHRFELLVLPGLLVCAGKELTTQLPHSPGALPNRENDEGHAPPSGASLWTRIVRIIGGFHFVLPDLSTNHSRKILFFSSGRQYQYKNYSGN